MLFNLNAEQDFFSRTRASSVKKKKKQKKKHGQPSDVKRSIIHF